MFLQKKVGVIYGFVKQHIYFPFECYQRRNSNVMVIFFILISAIVLSRIYIDSKRKVFIKTQGDFQIFV